MRTPGPWKFVIAREGLSDVGGFRGSDGSEVCWFGDSETYYPTEGSQPNPDDVRLIEGATELLEGALEFIEHGTTRRLRAAVKAIEKS